MELDTTFAREPDLTLSPDPDVTGGEVPARPAAAVTKTISLALQGGGAHGAFCRSVLDRLLEDERIGSDGISATSTGSMNAAVMAYGSGRRETACFRSGKSYNQ